MTSLYVQRLSRVEADGSIHIIKHVTLLQALRRLCFSKTLFVRLNVSDQDYTKTSWVNVQFSLNFWNE